MSRSYSHGAISLEISIGDDSQSVVITHSQQNNDRTNDRIETSDNGEIDQSEINVSPRKKKRTRILISDSESQETELDVFQDAESSAYENSGKYINRLAKFLTSSACKFFGKR